MGCCTSLSVLHAIRADLAKELLKGTSFPEAARASDAQQVEPPRATAVAPAAVALPDATIVETLAKMADERFSKILTHARATGRTNALPFLINRAVQDMHDQLRGLRESWCRATGLAPDRHGHSGYRPPAAMRRLIEARHETCVFPTCNRRSNRCDLDHTVPWGQGDHLPVQPRPTLQATSPDKTVTRLDPDPALARPSDLDNPIGKLAHHPPHPTVTRRPAGRSH
ncbi:hypothetical protein LUW76_10505 [Actinomadura madurae]|uniref:hypothetical protein n=1 Tax=Actinomadura madurae TaxID=1993 RepID=UPI0020276A30|nr:hypothetical protein [Actinomadura madurae]URM94719.1 hypothetical protein LUW76_10505 [Actinomadura madurae]